MIRNIIIRNIIQSKLQYNKKNIIIRNNIQSKLYIIIIIRNIIRDDMHSKLQLKSSSSSCRAASTDIPDPLSPLLPNIHRLWQIFRATSVSSYSCLQLK